jgi:hypothetical protein
MDTTREDNFIEKIEDCFPFTDSMECSALINEAAAISPKACIQVIKEICCIEDFQREEISDAQLIGMINEIKRKFDHPLKELLTDAAVKIIQGNELTLEQTLTGMQQVRKFPNFYPGLWILYFSCYADGEDVENLKEEIITEWDLIPE